VKYFIRKYVRNYAKKIQNLRRMLKDVVVMKVIE